MKIIVTGSLGHISKPLVQKLRSENVDVTVISSNIDRRSEIEALGAKAAIGSVRDQAFLTETFKGADAVYTMVPPTYAVDDWKKYIAEVGEIYASSIKAAGVKNVVNLSSIGAHMADGCGPVSGLYYVEHALNALEDVNVKHLRPGFFYYNFLNNAGLAKHMGIIGGNYGDHAKLVIAATSDIADVAAYELANLNFTGKSIRYIVSDEKTTDEVAAIFGKAIGKADLKWANFSDADSLGSMLQNGVPKEIASNYVEMGAAMRSGEMAAEYNKSRAATFGKTKLETFAPVFAEAYAKA